MLFPEWLQTALLVVLLGLVVKKTATKGVKQWQQEQKAKAEAAEVRADGSGMHAADAVFPAATVTACMLPTLPASCTGCGTLCSRCKGFYPQ